MTRERAEIRILSCIAFLISMAPAWASPLKNVLLFTRVGYFEHVGGIKACTSALENLAAQYHFTLKVSKDYNDLAVLGANPNAYDIVIFDNNTDAGGVTNTENDGQIALKEWLTKKGGRFLGIHSASDHRSQWAWYDTALFSGVRFSNFNDGQFTVYRDTSLATRENPALQNMYRYAEDSLALPTAEVTFNTEYYHFQDTKTYAPTDVRGRPGVTGFQELRGQYAIPNHTGQVLGWIKTLPNGGRFIYTALGHEVQEWSANNGWLAKMTWAYMKYLMGDFDVAPAAILPGILIRGHTLRVLDRDALRIQIIDVGGRVIASGPAADFGTTLARAGVYFVRVEAGNGKVFSRTVAIK